MDRLVIRSVDFDVCYRLDGTFPPSPGRFHWQTGVAERLDPSAESLGATVRRESATGEFSYLPWTGNQNPGPLKSRWVIQVPVVEISLTWQPVDGGASSRTAASWQGYQPGGEVLELELAPPTSFDLWRLELTGVTPDGEPVVWQSPVLWEETPR